jgi:hypothetical protein
MTEMAHMDRQDEQQGNPPQRGFDEFGWLATFFTSPLVQFLLVVAVIVLVAVWVNA